MFNYLIAVLVTAFSLPALAGQSTGNGGDAVVCRDLNQKILSAELLDLYESREDSWGFSLDLGISNDIQKRVSVAIDRLSKVDQLRAQRYSGRVTTFFQEAEFKDVELIDIPDSQHLFFPSGCGVEQLAVHREPQFRGQSRYLINNEIWNVLDLNNKAALVLHEIIYREAFEYGHSDSRASRHLNAWLTSKEFENVTSQEFKRFLEKGDFYPELNYPDIHINKIFNRFPDGRIAYGTTSSETPSYFEHRGQKVKLGRGTGIQFHTNGFISWAKVTNVVQAKIAGHKLELTHELYFDEHGEIIGGYLINASKVAAFGRVVNVRSGGLIKIYPNGKWERLPLVNDEKLKVGNYDLTFNSDLSLHGNGGIYIGHLSQPTTINVKGQPVAFYNEVHFYPDGCVHHGQLKAATTIKVQNRPAIFNGHITFHNNGSVYKGETLIFPTFLVNGQKLSAQGKVAFYPSESIEEISTPDKYVGKFLGQTVSSTVEDPGTGLKLTESGEIIRGRITQPQLLKINANTSSKLVGRLEFSTTHLLIGQLVEDTVLNGPNGKGLKFSATFDIAFHLNGNLKGGKLIDPAELQVNDRMIKFAAGHLQFSEQSKVIGGHLVQPTPFHVQEKWVDFAGAIKLYEDGTVREGTLTSDQTLDTENDETKLFKAGKAIEFNEDGTVIDLGV